MLARGKSIVGNIRDGARAVTCANEDGALCVASPRLRQFNSDLVLFLQRESKRLLRLRYRVVNDSGKNCVASPPSTNIASGLPTKFSGDSSGNTLVSLQPVNGWVREITRLGLDFADVSTSNDIDHTCTPIMGSVKETAHFTRTANQIRVREDALLNRDSFKSHQFSLLVVHADHGVELAAGRIQRDTHRNDHGALVAAHVREALQSDALHLHPRHVNIGHRIRVWGAVSGSNKVRLFSIHVFDEQNAGISGQLGVAGQCIQAVAVALGPEPTDRAAVCEHAIGRRQVTGHDIGRRVRFQRVANLPCGARVLCIPANDYRAHAVSNLMTAPLLHLHHQTVFLPPSGDGAGSGQCAAV